ncbi:MAG: hypothetical protein AAFQ35_07310 [Pseudomonadota bacterium]
MLTEYNPPGPIAQAFLNDRETKVRALMGPQGSGKTGTCAFDLLSNAAQMPVCKDGVRHFRAITVRETYNDLYATTIPSWWDWVPKSMGRWDGPTGRPASHKLDFELPGAGPLRFEMHFLALGDRRVEDALRGYEFTAAWLNEMDLVRPDVMTYVVGRIGRFPPQRWFAERTNFRRFVIGDLNAPDTDNYCYTDFVEHPKSGYKLYRQPGGRSPGAENLQNLVPGYYDDQAELNAHQPWWIKRFIDSEFGYSRDGRPVYEEFNDEVHVAPHALTYRRGIPVRIGLDQGFNAAAVFSQWMPDGQWRVIHEIEALGSGPRTFARLIAQHLAEHCGDCPIERIYCDPAGFAGSSREGENDLQAWAEILQRELQMPIYPSPSQAIAVRLQAVREMLTHQIDGKFPSFLLSPACPRLRRGFNADYRYRQLAVGKYARLENRPDKTNGFSDVQDALQCAVLGAKGRHGVIDGNRLTPASGRRSRAAPARRPGDFDVFSV